VIHEGIKDRYPILWEHIQRDENGSRWQTEVAQFITDQRPSIVVETGVYLGVSADRILRATNGLTTKLYSIDPGYKFMPTPEVHPMDLTHERWNPWRTTSLIGMPRVYHDTGPWDVFIHDSDHEVECQSFELALGWLLLRPGGWLMSDDYTWGTPPHRAWERVMKSCEVGWRTIGSVAIAQKPSSADIPSREHQWLLDRWQGCVEIARLAAIEYGVAPTYEAELWT